MNVCVFGSGVMGLGIAQVLSLAQCQVTLLDVNDAILDKARAGLDKSIAKMTSKGKLTPEQQAMLESIEFSARFEKAENAELILEAICENAAMKKELFGKLDGICPQSAIFASNTSALSITELSLATKRPNQVIGMHFFNPAPQMKLVEIVRGLHTQQDVFSKVWDLAIRAGKTPVEVCEAPGFVVNRILIPMINEAVGILAQGIASANDIDTAMKLGANHPMGPLALGDLVGLDVCLSIMDTLQQETGDPKYRAHPLLRKMVRGGMLGKKSGKGFFVYE